MQIKYPHDSQIKVKWMAVHVVLLSISIILPLLYLLVNACNLSSDYSRLFIVFGLSFSVAGTTIATLKPPYYGSFSDGGKIEFKREQVASKYFHTGMIAAALGFVFQAFGALIS